MSQIVTPAERIQELSAISSDVATMLKAAGLAINTLTGRKVDPADQGDNDTSMTDDLPTSLETQKKVFEDHVNDYYTTLQAISARLRRQVYALEEAGIISSEAAALGAARGTAGSAATEQRRITNGGLGNLDVGWLNSRGNRVGAEKESEITNEIKELLKDELAKDG